MKKCLSVFAVIAAVASFSCENFESAAPLNNELLDGPVDGLSESDNIRFLRGDVAFNDEVFTAGTGAFSVFK